MENSLYKLGLLLADTYKNYIPVKKWEREVTSTRSVEHICLSFWFEDECGLDKIHIYFFKEGLTASAFPEWYEPEFFMSAKGDNWICLDLVPNIPITELKIREQLRQALYKVVASWERETVYTSCLIDVNQTPATQTI